MTDLEMLELAAKAAGLEVHRGDKWQSDMLFRAVPRPNSPLVANVEWNPLSDDGDALRLACRLKMNIAQGDFSAGVNDEVAFVRNEDDRPAVIRRLIATAAATNAAPTIAEDDVALWKCTGCGRIGSVGRCCGDHTREPYKLHNTPS